MKKKTAVEQVNVQDDASIDSQEYQSDQSDYSDQSNSESEQEQSEEPVVKGKKTKAKAKAAPVEQNPDEEEANINEKTIQRLKKKINDWLDYDDKIKVISAKMKKYKDAKKQQEEIIITMITKLKVNDKKIDVHDDNNNFRGRVYRHKSVTKEALKENIIKDALMEAIRDEKKVDQLIKKIDSKRPVKERYYLKRTKGNQD